MNKEKIILENQGLIGRVATKLAKMNPAYCVDDLMQVGNMALWEKLDKYDKERNTKLSTFITICVRNDMLKYLNKERKYLERKFDTTKADQTPEERYFIKDFSDKYDEETGSVIELKTQGYTNKDIGKNLNISQGKIKKIIDKVKRDL